MKLAIPGMRAVHKWCVRATEIRFTCIKIGQSSIYIFYMFNVADNVLQPEHRVKDTKHTHFCYNSNTFNKRAVTLDLTVYTTSLTFSKKKKEYPYPKIEK